jgi:hypothetical protein
MKKHVNDQTKALKKSIVSYNKKIDFLWQMWNDQKPIHVNMYDQYMFDAENKRKKIYWAADGCALCKLNNDETNDSCETCIITKYIGKNDCKGTPWVKIYEEFERLTKWLSPHSNKDIIQPDKIGELLNLFCVEQNFLEALLTIEESVGKCERENKEEE